MSAPDGHFIKNLIILGSPPQTVAQGAFIHAPDLFNASESTRMLWNEAMRKMLRGLGLHTHCQTHLDIGHDFQKDLDRYAQDTKKTGKADAGTLLRDQIYIEFSEKQKERKLRRPFCRLYLCKRIDEKRPPGTFTPEQRMDYWKNLLDEKAREFQNAFHSLDSQLARIGSSVIPMTDQDHFKHYSEFFNPGMKPQEDFDPMQSIKTQTIRSGIRSGHKQAPPFGFYKNGHYHNFIILSRPPREVEAGMIRELSNLHLIDFRIVSTIIPLDPKKFIQEKQLELNRTKDTYVKSGDEASDTAIGLKKRIIRDITHGFLPFQWLCVFHLWDTDLPALITKSRTIKDAIHNWDDADYYEPTLPATCKKLWDQIHPGWAFGGYEAHAIYMNDLMMAKVMTMDSAFEGDLKHAWALYKNHNNGIVGVTPFRNGTPLASCLIGMTGAGKSEFLKNYICQCMPMLSYVVLIEEGFSHEELARMFGTRPKVIHTNSRLCFNPFDTQQLPLTPSFVDTCSTLLTRMFGNIQAEDEKFLIKAYISEYIVRVYEDLFKQKTDSARRFNLGRQAYAAFLYEEILKEKESDSSFIDAWTQLRELGDSDISKVLYEKATEERVVHFMKNPSTASMVRDAYFATCGFDQVPTLSMLVESMEFPKENHDSKRLELIITILRSWCADVGSKGGLFDGYTNLPPSDRLSLWELSKLGDSENELKQLIGFQISHHERQKIMTMPRSLYKMFVIEEGSRYLSIPGSEKSVEELWAQMRKYRCAPLFTVQQYAQFARSRIASIILGNSKQFFLLRQNDIEDVRDLCARVPSIPEPAREAILNYDMPENNNNSASWFTYYRMDSIRPVCGTVKFEKPRNQ